MIVCDVCKQEIKDNEYREGWHLESGKMLWKHSKCAEIRFYQGKNKVHYLIVKWDEDKLTYTVVSWSHSYENMLLQLLLFPESKGYIHLIEFKYLKAHGIMEEVQMLRERAKVQGLTEKDLRDES